MIRVAVIYPNKQDRKFDINYYINNHMPLVVKKYTPYGLINAEIDSAKVKAGKQGAPYIAIGYMIFESTKLFMQAFQAVGNELMADVVNFTDIEPEIQISEYHKISF
ncbi:EthD family reductase [Pseudocolwellia sp. HL-MZ19]|uniref:EthD family reductase n=1 Tax=Pseudocolwellia sp. HL-MZ19 TaxID=3400846 RepID=UPI003CF1C41F